MAQNMELREAYSNIVEAKLRAESIFAELFNRRHEGNAVAGAVKIPVRSDATVGDYDIAQGGELKHTATTYATLVCDNDKYVNELIDGYVAAAVPDALVADRLDSAGYSLADETDTDLIALAVAQGTTFTASKKASTVYGTITEAIQTAKKGKVKPNEMWLAVSNDYALEVINDANFIAASNLGDAIKQNGLLGRINGVAVYESVNIPEGTDFVLGNSVYCHYVPAWAVPVAVKDLADGKHIGACAVQGRQVFGAMISKPATVLVKKNA